jgi:hypothetical protein
MKGVTMKTTSLLRLMIISLFSISLIGSVAAGVFDQLEGRIQDKHFERESTRLSGFMSSPQYTLLEPKFAKPDLARFSDGMPKSDMIKIDLFEKNLWREIPAIGPHCPTCGFDNATTKFGSMFTEDYKTLMPNSFFGGGGGGAGAGGGCCGG